MALSHLKFATEISNLATDQSAQASACRAFYDTVRSAVLRDFKWPFATNIVQLGLLTTNPFPNQNGDSEWGYSYQYPSDAANIVRVMPGLQVGSRQARIPYRIYAAPAQTTGSASNPAGRQILCNLQNAMVEYVIDVQTEDLFSPDFVLAFSLRLAAYIAPRVTAGDPFKLGARAIQMYMAEIDRAKVNAVNEEQIEHDQESEFILARGASCGRRGSEGYW